MLKPQHMQEPEIAVAYVNSLFNYRTPFSLCLYETKNPKAPTNCNGKLGCRGRKGNSPTVPEELLGFPHPLAFLLLFLCPIVSLSTCSGLAISSLSSHVCTQEVRILLAFGFTARCVRWGSGTME